MKLIKLNEDHYIIVDDSEIKDGDWFLNTVQRNIYCNNIPNYDVDKDYLKKITHSTQPLDKSLFFTNRVWGCERLSLGEVKELIGEVDVEKKIISPYPINTQNDVDWCNGYQRGYNQAIEDNKDKKWTDEDMRNAIKMGRDIIAFDQGMIPWYKFKFVDIIQSLQPKTEWEVELIDNKLKLL